MTHEERLKLAEAQGMLEVALRMVGVQRDSAEEGSQREWGDYMLGFWHGEIRVASDVVKTLERVIALIEPLWKGTRNERAEPDTSV